MIKDNQKKFNGFHVALDGVVIVLAYLVAWLLLLLGNRIFSPEINVLAPQYYFAALLILVPMYLLLYGFFHLYAPKRVQARRYEFSNILKANLLGVLLFTLILFLIKKNPYFKYYSTRMVFYFFAINIILETIERNLIRQILHSMRTKGYNQKHILLIGYSRAAEGFIDRVLYSPEWGYQIKGILDNTKEWGASYKDIHVIGKLNDLDEILSLNSLDEIAITLSISEYADLERIVASCEKSGVHTKFIPDYNNMIPTRPFIEDLQGLPVVNIRRVPLTDPVNALVKRAVDLFGAAVALIVFSPVMLLTAVLIKLTAPGPLIYKQERVGLHNKSFSMYKFRSMVVQAPSEERLKWTTPHDSRVTPVGRFIRKTSIDEMPQFFNVLRGDMSLVGPRPERPLFVGKFKEEIPRYMIKHQVRPGITGWAQVNGFRGDTSITKRIEHDLYYIENWTLGFDFKILFFTGFKGFINKNAY
ncbi:undecaprenyl-phosphate glucose phosphotransferase [Clostridium sp. E02]|uniref:undecaprenyl-phosphate glucose phosphotransferase n=1 Tax=Clostridium sp. E02 TaxID=2487134 RepID=UPI000F51C4A5|nr:undecaprenyl-phosphate glucose phosphotransferase [Clostridium sp. E02]